MEAASEAGEILLSPETAAALDAALLGERRGGVLLRRSAPATRTRLEPLPDVDGLPLELAVPAPLRAQLLEVGPLEGEHRKAAVAFVRFSGIDEVIATEGPASAAAGARRARPEDPGGRGRARRDVPRERRRARRRPDRAVAGAPRRSATTRSACCAPCARPSTGPTVPVHVGVSRGRVFTGQVGATFRRTYTILGDTAALAARLMARAGRTRSGSRPTPSSAPTARFEGTELEPFFVKGKSEPVARGRARRLAARKRRLAPSASCRSSTASASGRSSAPRWRPCAWASGRSSSSSASRGSASRGSRRSSVRSARTCSSSAPLRPVRVLDAVSRVPARSCARSSHVELNGGGTHNRAVLCAAPRPIDAELVPGRRCSPRRSTSRWSRRPRWTSSTRRSGARVSTASSASCSALLDSPTLLVFEDVHWMDDASSELLRHLGTQLPTSPGSPARPGGPGDGGFAAAEGRRRCRR